ncbi:hypothetical protein M406DRAFT_72153 [Cryphonectria parasitica EP155]|uniref:Uncharacterized protein n=1 Tax=Cryphonectria parasitica (strain ATCC 38755 / EP155) TaxID=660469 RepID=A0A9P5CLL0_CRYP1|nr:uncharacterized protein M406DRAFT_72153 [Cryphonectria parasitica EP155]KAF3762126.1 hypothetical protein M406DRAFT_72153 [Cryphonectria parasitica EP155]
MGRACLGEHARGPKKMSSIDHSGEHSAVRTEVPDQDSIQRSWPQGRCVQLNKAITAVHLSNESNEVCRTTPFSDEQSDEVGKVGCRPATPESVLGRSRAKEAGRPKATDGDPLERPITRMLDRVATCLLAFERDEIFLGQATFHAAAAAACAAYLPRTKQGNFDSGRQSDDMPIKMFHCRSFFPFLTLPKIPTEFRHWRCRHVGGYCRPGPWTIVHGQRGASAKHVLPVRVPPFVTGASAYSYGWLDK